MTEVHGNDTQETDRLKERVKEPERADSHNARAENARRAGLPEDERNSFTTPTE